MSCIKSIQRGTDTSCGVTTKSVDVTISEVDLNKAFVIINCRASEGSSEVLGQLTSPTSLTLSSRGYYANNVVVTNWQVIEFA